MNTNAQCYLSMKIRKLLVLFFVLLLILIFFWQIILIIKCLTGNLSGINSNQMNISKNVNASRIPRIIHQMWKNKDLSTYPIESSYSQWKNSYPNYKIRLWTDEDLEELIQTKQYEYLYSIYKSYSYSIQRADLGRLIILHSEGGIYADLDVFPSFRSIENLILSNMSLIIPRSFTGSSLINHFLLAEKSSPILDFILHQIRKKTFYEKIYFSPYLEVFSDGSFYLTKTTKKYLRLSSDNSHQLWILSEKDLDMYISHHTGRSWHLLDGFILNQIDARPKLFIVIMTFWILLILFIFKFKFRFSNKKVSN